MYVRSTIITVCTYVRSTIITVCTYVRSTIITVCMYVRSTIITVCTYMCVYSVVVLECYGACDMQSGNLAAICTCIISSCIICVQWAILNALSKSAVFIALYSNECRYIIWKPCETINSTEGKFIVSRY